MATLPKATVTVSETASAFAAGTDVLCMLAPVPNIDDLEPRQFGSADAIYQLHGYSEGVEYAALHAQQARKPILFVGMPIETPGAVSREDTSGNSDSSVTTVTAGVDGSLTDHEGEITVVVGGTIGADQIQFDLSLDDGVTTQRVRLGTANSYTIPFVGVSVSFAAGDLTAGDVIHTWTGTGPKSNATSWATARANLASQTKQFRSMLMIEQMDDSTDADAFNTELEAYRTANDRFVYGRAHIYDRSPLATMSQTSERMTGDPSLTFVLSGSTITRGAGSWISDGFVLGDTVTITDTASNDGTYTISVLTATVMTTTESLVDEGPSTGFTVVGTPTITFAEVGATGDTITRSRGSWLTDGFRVGDSVSVLASVSNNISDSDPIAGVTALVLTMDTEDLAAEVIGQLGLSVSAGQTKAAWMAEVDAAFASVTDAFRIDLAAGRARVLSPFTGWRFRRPPSWAASLREYQHDLHTTTWKKEDGPTGFNLYNPNGALVEWDDREDGEAGVAARFTVFRSWANGPVGAFIALSLTRALDGSVLSLTHNVAVVNLACLVTQLSTENVVGRSLVLNDDGTGTTDSLNTIQSEVNAALELELLQNAIGEGPRASKAVWTPSADDILNVPAATLNGILDLVLNGTVHSINTDVRVRSGGQ